MALDNAQFISELSIVDPPGTDPLSQGDDQIRTIKRATQQSFPNIDAAVTLTAVQMNLAAIKNEANVFTAIQTFTTPTAAINVDVPLITDIAAIQFSEATINRWTIGKLGSGSNSDFFFTRRDVLGDFVDIPYKVGAADGVVDFLHVPTVDGAPLWVAGELRMFVANTTPGTNWFVADGTNGTVNLDNRILMAEGSSAAGTNLNPNLVGTAAAGTTGSTALTEANLASHRHRIAEKSLSGGQVQANPATVLVAGQGVAGVILSSGTQSYADQTADARSIIENTGSGTGHTHSKAAAAVTENGTSRDTVRPLSRTVQYHQYVP